jgi:hypothetical protein
MLCMPWSRSTHRERAEETIAAFQELGIPVLPQKLRRKGSYVTGWPIVPVDRSAAMSREALRRQGNINLAGRTGQGTAVIDPDGKNGIDPAAVLGRIIAEAYDALICVVKTARGYQSWLRVVESVGNGFCASIGGDVFSECHLAMLPPSVHPSGKPYEWVITPRRPTGVADLRALGFVPDIPEYTTGGAARRKSPAPPNIQLEFARLMSSLGITPGARGCQPCPWHDDREPSLSVHWEAALFNCFGEECGVHGNLRALRRLLSQDTPSYFLFRSPNAAGEAKPYGNKSGCAPSAGRERLLAALGAIGGNKERGKISGCRTRFLVRDCGCAEPTGLPIWCRHPLCPECFQASYLRGLNQKVGSLPGTFHLLRVTARGTLARPGISQLRRRFVDWRRRAKLKAGLYGIRHHRLYGAVALLAIPVGEAPPSSSRAFSVEVVAGEQPATAVAAFFGSEFWDEITGWQSEDELKLLLDETSRRRRHQTFGRLYGAASKSSEAKEGETGPKSRTCQHCGEVLQLRPHTVSAEKFVFEDGRYRLRESDGGVAA